ncbi:MAG TPA: membrane protein insertion efficiency factor YidD [Vulgatibacter sp.]|nr:membrane protein insertion efficiency factor YidD [Vulgatibacter sp.]
MIGHFARRILAVPIRFYRALLSPLLPASCRFHPSCSAYALQALEEHGAGRGLWLTLRRIARCHPFHAGGIDPVPPSRGRRLEKQSGDGPA